MANGTGASPFILPNQFDALGNVIQNRIAYNEREKLRGDEDQWKKLGLIQELTDLSKHQTGSDVANAIGNQKAGELFQKYTALSGKMSPSELAMNIQKDIGGLTTSMDGLKMEMDNGENEIAQIKKMYPDLDAASLMRNYRADILNRHLKSNTEFYNPYEVKQSDIDLTDPDYLSQYVNGNKNIADEIINPKGADESSVFVGNPNNYTKLTAKIPYYKKANFTPDQITNGFVKSGVQPHLQFKTETLPSAAIPNSNTKPFDMAAKDVYDRFSQNEKSNLELIAATKKTFPDYDKFNSTEKEYAKRKMLLDMMKGLDNTDYHPTEVHSPSASLQRLWLGIGTGGNGGEAKINDAYGRIAKASHEASLNGGYLQVNSLSSDDQGLAIDQVKKLTGDNTIGNGDFYIQEGSDGTNGLYLTPKKAKELRRSTSYLGTLSQSGVNLKGQYSKKQKDEVMKQSEHTQSNTSDWKTRAKKVN